MVETMEEVEVTVSGTLLIPNMTSRRHCGNELALLQCCNITWTLKLQLLFMYLNIEYNKVDPLMRIFFLKSLLLFQSSCIHLSVLLVYAIIYIVVLYLCGVSDCISMTITLGICISFKMCSYLSHLLFELLKSNTII